MHLVRPVRAVRAVRPVGLHLAPPRVFGSESPLAIRYVAFSRLLPELLSQYRGRYVALHEGAVLAIGDTEVEALNLAYSRQPEALVLVRKVTDQPEPIERLPYFRHVGRAQEVKKEEK